MTKDDSHIEKWVQDYLVQKRPELVNDFVEARRICLRIRMSGILEHDDPERLLALARSPHAPLGVNVALMIGETYAQVPTLGSIIRTLAGGSRVHERVNSLVALSSHPATELHSDLLSVLLKDKSARVRALAADKIVEHGLMDLAAELEAALNSESKPVVAQELRAYLDYLRHGFHVRPFGNHISVTCRLPGEGSVSMLFDPADYEAEGPAWIRSTLSSYNVA